MCLCPSDAMAQPYANEEINVTMLVWGCFQDRTTKLSFENLHCGRQRKKMAMLAPHVRCPSTRPHQQHGGVDVRLQTGHPLAPQSSFSPLLLNYDVPFHCGVHRLNAMPDGEKKNEPHNFRHTVQTPHSVTLHKHWMLCIVAHHARVYATWQSWSCCMSGR